METPTVCTKEMKDWFGHGEVDVDAMLRMGAVSEETILKLWLTCTDSPYVMAQKENAE